MRTKLSKRIIFFFSLLFLFGSKGYAQSSHYKDSLLAELKQQYGFQSGQVVDTIFLNLLNEIAFEYIFFNPDSAIFYGNIASQLAQKPEHFRYKANAYMYSALAYDEMQELTESIRLHDLAAQLFLQNNDSLSYAKAIVNKSNTLKHLRNYSESLKALITAKDIAKRYGAHFFYYQCATNLGNLYLQIDDLENAEKYILEAYEVYKAKDIKRGLMMVLPNLGVIYSKKGQQEIAIKFAEEYVRLAKELNEPYYIASSLNELGLYYLRAGKPLASILSVFNRAITVSKVLNNNKLTLDLHLAKAEALLKHNKNSEALSELVFIRENLLIEDDIKLLSVFFNSFAKALFNLGRYEEAVNAFERFAHYDHELKKQKYSDEIKFMKLQQLQASTALLEKEQLMDQEKLVLQSRNNKLIERRNLIILIASILLLIAGSGFFVLMFKANKLKESFKKANDLLHQEQNLFVKGPVIAFQISDADSLKFSYLSENIHELLAKLNCNVPYHTLNQLIELPEEFHSELIRKAYESEDDFVMNTTLVCEDNRIRCRLHIKAIREENQIKSLFGFIVDIDEAFRLNQSLNQMQSLLESTNSIGKIGSFRFDLKNNQVILSKEDLRINELNENDQLNFETAIQMHTPGESRERVLQQFYSLSPEHPMFSDEFEIITPTGELKVVSLISKAHFENGELIYTEGTMMDITEERKQQKELEDALLFTDEQNKRLKNFTHIVSHNLRSHSGNFELVLNLLKEADPDDKELIEAIEINTIRLKETLDHLNEVVKVQSNQNIPLKKIHLRSEIAKIIESMMLGNLRETPEIIVNIDAHQSIHYVPAYFESVMYNLISNAIKYKHPERKAIVEVSFSENDSYHMISVKDNGLGIDLKKYGDKLFGMYKTFHKNVDARGVGLFLTKNQLEYTGGKIEVESEPNQGTLFRVFFGKQNQTVISKA